MKADDLPWINWDAAMSRVRQIQDLGERQFVMTAATILFNRFGQRNFPVGVLDVAYVVDLLIEMYAQKESLARIIAGEDLRWFPDEDGLAPL